MHTTNLECFHRRRKGGAVKVEEHANASVQQEFVARSGFRGPCEFSTKQPNAKSIKVSKSAQLVRTLVIRS